MGKEKYIDQYHKPRWQLIADREYSIFNTAQALLENSGHYGVAYVPGLSVSELEEQSKRFLKVRRESPWGYDPNTGAPLGQAKVLVLPDERSCEHYDPSPETNVRQVAPNCRFVVGEECDKLLALLKKMRGRELPITKDPYGRKDFYGHTVTFGVDWLQDRELSGLVYEIFNRVCFTHDTRYRFLYNMEKAILPVKDKASSRPSAICWWTGAF